MNVLFNKYVFDRSLILQNHSRESSRDYFKKSLKFFGYLVVHVYIGIY